MENRAGRYIKNLEGKMAYYSFLPSSLPPNPRITLNDDIIKNLAEAKSQLSYLNGLSERIPNIGLFISMSVRKEALLSSQIEGTQCTLEDIFNPANENNQNQDVNDVVNYVKATEYALQRLNELPLCNRLLRETHAVLLDSTRGQEKNPGTFRTSQNWIGGNGSTIANAVYIPPNPEDMNSCLSDLEKYINYGDDLDPLIQAALIHYQFETIHPFLDGNGRIGRMMIILFLIEKKIITTPSLYISYYLKLNRIEYYDRMGYIRKSGDYEQWINFFLMTMIAAAKDTIDTINQMYSLHNKNAELISSSLSSRKAVNVFKVFTYLENYPIIDIKKTASALTLSFNTVSTVLTSLKSLGIVYDCNGNERNRTFIYKDYLEILKKGT